jgi:hypothetical protein
MNKLTIISGCPRSGTSICSILLRSVLDDKENFLGAAFPQENKRKTHLQRLEEMEDGEMKDYFMKKYELIKDQIVEPEPKKDYKDLNPEGFFENRYTVKGITWHKKFPDLTNKYCKIVSQGLATSDPQYIGKIIYMVRDPRQVAKSQERLGREHETPERAKIHTPEMFVSVSAQASNWILANKKEDDVLIVNYDNLVSDPEFECKRIEGFLGLKKKIDHTLVQPKLKRSEPEDVKNNLFEVADEMFEALKKGDWKGVLISRKKHIKEIQKDKMQTSCVRLNENMAYRECKNCLLSKTMKETLKKRAVRKGIDWNAEPCMFLCKTNPDAEPVSLKETIDNNHWADNTTFEPPTFFDKVKSAGEAILDSSKRVVKGQKLIASPLRQKVRRDICRECPFRIKNKCGACGCGLAAKQKLENSSCPKGKW